MPAVRSWFAGNELAGTIVLNGLVALVGVGRWRSSSCLRPRAGER